MTFAELLTRLREAAEELDDLNKRLEKGDRESFSLGNLEGAMHTFSSATEYENILALVEHAEALPEPDSAFLELVSKVKVSTLQALAAKKAITADNLGDSLGVLRSAIYSYRAVVTPQNVLTLLKYVEKP